MKEGAPCHIEFPDRTPGEADITAMQIQMLVDWGVEVIKSPPTIRTPSVRHFARREAICRLGSF